MCFEPQKSPYSNSVLSHVVSKEIDPALFGLENTISDPGLY